MRRAAVALAVAAVALLGCGDDSDDAGSDETTTTTSPDPILEDCAASAVERAPAEAVAAFPDSPDVTWAVLGSREGGLGTVLVDLEPDPDEVGYPSFTFVMSCGTGGPVHLATYALDGGDHVLLATTDAAAGIDFAPILEE